MNRDGVFFIFEFLRHLSLFPNHHFFESPFFIYVFPLSLFSMSIFFTIFITIKWVLIHFFNLIIFLFCIASEIINNNNMILKCNETSQMYLIIKINKANVVVSICMSIFVMQSQSSKSENL